MSAATGQKLRLTRDPKMSHVARDRDGMGWVGCDWSGVSADKRPTCACCGERITSGIMRRSGGPPHYCNRDSCVVIVPDDEP